MQKGEKFKNNQLQKLKVNLVKTKKLNGVICLLTIHFVDNWEQIQFFKFM